MSGLFGLEFVDDVTFRKRNQSYDSEVYMDKIFECDLFFYTYTTKIFFSTLETPLLLRVSENKSNFTTNDVSLLSATIVQG